MKVQRYFLDRNPVRTRWRNSTVRGWYPFHELAPSWNVLASWGLREKNGAELTGPTIAHGVVHPRQTLILVLPGEHFPDFGVPLISGQRCGDEKRRRCRDLTKLAQNVYRQDVAQHVMYRGFEIGVVAVLA